MTRYVIKRILLALLTIFLICALTFFLMHAVPGGPFNREKALDAATIQALEERYGLNRPVGEQFLSYMKNVLKGDFGVSLKNGRNITDIFKDSFPISAKLGLMAIAVALVCGVIFGSIAALMRNKLPDRIIVFFSTLFTAVPSFVLATLLLLVFGLVVCCFAAARDGLYKTIQNAIDGSCAPGLFPLVSIPTIVGCVGALLIIIAAIATPIAKTQRMREVWFYLIHLFDDAEKLNKQLRRFRTPAEYERIQAEILASCPIRSNVQGDLI